MRATPWLLVTSLTILGCPSSPSSPTASSSSTSTAAKPIPSGMPIAPVRMGPTRTEGEYWIDTDALHQAIALATANKLPLSKTTNGYRVLRADEGSMMASAGFRVDDELLRIANVPVTAPDLLVQLHPVWDQTQFQIAYRRGGQERSHTFLMYKPPPPRPVRGPDGDGGGTATPFDQEAFAKAVTTTADGTIEVKRKAFEMLLENQSAVMRSARIVPRKEGDRIVGLKLFGIRRGSPLEVLGLKNGDTLKTVAGYDISSPDKALEAYSKMRGATKTEVVITRRGEPLTLRYRLID